MKIIYKWNKINSIHTVLEIKECRVYKLDQKKNQELTI